MIPKHKRNYSNQIIFMLNYDRQQAGDAVLGSVVCCGVGSEPSQGLCVSLRYTLNGPLVRPGSGSGFLMKLYTK